MKKFIVLFMVGALTTVLGSCGKTLEIPIPKKVVISQVEKQFPLEKSSLLTVKLSDPKVEFDGTRGKIIIHLNSRVSAPFGLAAQDGTLTVESGLDYNAAKKSVVLKEPALSQLSIAGLDSDKLGQVKELIVPLIGKTLDGLTAYTFDQGSMVEKLASQHLAGFRITDDKLIIQIK